MILFIPNLNKSELDLLSRSSDFSILPIFILS